MSNPNLKPCPFCGGKAEIQISGRYTGDCSYPKALQGCVHCQECDIRGCDALKDFLGGQIEGFTRASFKCTLTAFAQELADCWNRRAKPTRPERFALPEERCGTCRYFDDTARAGEGDGVCVHNPPSLRGPRGAYHGVFPPMNTNDWCGSWKSTIIDPKEKEKLPGVDENDLKELLEAMLGHLQASLRWPIRLKEDTDAVDSNQFYNEFKHTFWKAVHDLGISMGSKDD